MKKILLICSLMFLCSAGLLYAENNENNGVPTPVLNVPTKIEGTLREDIPTNPSVRLSGDELDCPNGVIYIPSIPPIDNSILPNPDDPTSNSTYPGLKQMPKLHRNEYPSILDGPRWGTDIRIADKRVGEGQDFDEDEVTHDIYAGFDTDHSTYDSIFIYKSTDAGQTWNQFIIGYNADGSVGNPKVRVVRDASGQSWVCFIGIWYEPTGARQLWSRRVKTDGTGAIWEQVAPDSVTWADIDGDVGTGAWLYCTYVIENPTNMRYIYAGRNGLGGAGWQDITDLFDDPQALPYPAIAAGAGGNVGVAFIDDRLTTNQEVRIKRSTNYGQTWIASAQVSNNSGAAQLRYTDIGYSHGATQTGWIFVTFGWTTDEDIDYYYSTNSGVNWTHGGIISPFGDNQNMSTVRCLKSSATGAITVAYNCDPGDSTMFTWTLASNPTGFGAGRRINDYAATGYWPPTAGWIWWPGGGMHSAVIYSSWIMNYRPYYDWLGNPGIEEMDQQTTKNGLHLAPNPSNGLVRLSYVTKQPGKVSISLYDATGRLINNLLNETKPAGNYTLNLNNQELPSGIYFIRVETPDGTSSKTMTIIR